MTKRAIIIGGGVGGLCTAIALRQIGVEATVYEKAQVLGDVGAGLVIWANAIRALRALGLADQVIAAGSKLERGEIRTSTGQTLVRTAPGELERTYGEPTVAIHRAALHKILLAALPAYIVRLGAPCVRFEQDTSGVTAHFEDGTTDQAELLIGADGIRSIIRNQLFPEVKLRYSGYTAWRGAIMTRDEAALGLTSESWGRGQRFGIVRLDAERIYWFATANTAPGKTFAPVDRKALLQKIFAGWHHPIEHLLDTTAPDMILHNDIYDIAPLKQWSVGRVTLLGDAAHATTPNMGQGACMAIESAVVLTRCLSKTTDITAALRAYELQRQPRTAWITNQSWQIGRVGQLQNPFACTVRDLIVRLTPDRTMKANLACAINFDPTAQSN